MNRLEMPILWNRATRMHDPRGGVWVGVRIDDDEVAGRVDELLAAVETAGAQPVEVASVDPADLTAVHDPGLLEFLEAAWPAWERSGYLDDPGMDRVVAYTWPPHAGASPPPNPPGSVSAWAGMYATDTMTLIGPGTWEAVVGAASTALGAADEVAGGAPVAYALARPPGHHAGTGFFGGSCYLNNAALAAARLASRGASVTVIDIDAHHGNGTQEIFWDRRDVVYGSVHVDPAFGWYPHFAGHADETGGAPATNLNIPLPPGSGDQAWLAAVETLAGFTRGDVVVVSLGVDAAASDPQSPLEVSRDAYAEAGRILAAAGLPCVVVQEGGYVLDTLGDLVVAFLSGLEGGTR